MEKRKHNFIRFDAIHICDYGIFSGSNEFRFKKRRTIIFGDNGSGKSTIFNALAPREPEPTVWSDSRSPLVQVMTTGDRGLITKYRQLIFIDGESLSFRDTNDTNRVAHHLGRGHSATELENIAWDIFERLVGKWSRESTELANRRSWAMGEWICYGYAQIFAARSMLNVDLPLVFDAPEQFVVLDMERRKELTDYLDEIDGQQIFAFAGSVTGISGRL